MRVAVVGGTGTVGRYVLTALATAGHQGLALTRSNGVDVRTGAGLDGALEGVQAVVDVGNVVTLRRRTAEEFFGQSSRRLVAAGARAGVEHHVVLSIVGVDRVATGYYRGKRLQEAEVRAGSVPFTVLRATQFHEFPGQVLGATRGPVAPVPRMRMQPVAAEEVGARLAELAVRSPLGAAPELAGPEVHELVDLARRVEALSPRRRRVIPVRQPGRAGPAMAGGALLPGPHATLGRVTFDEWLATRR